MPADATPEQVEETWKYLTNVDAKDDGHISAILIKSGGIPIGFVLGDDTTKKVVERALIKKCGGYRKMARNSSRRTNF
jgi:hypothetical protein